MACQTPQQRRNCNIPTTDGRRNPECFREPSHLRVYGCRSSPGSRHPEVSCATGPEILQLKYTLITCSRCPLECRIHACAMTVCCKGGATPWTLHAAMVGRNERTQCRADFVLSTNGESAPVLLGAGLPHRWQLVFRDAFKSAHVGQSQSPGFPPKAVASKPPPNPGMVPRAVPAGGKRGNAMSQPARLETRHRDVMQAAPETLNEQNNCTLRTKAKRNAHVADDIAPSSNTIAFCPRR